MSRAAATRSAAETTEDATGPGRIRIGISGWRYGGWRGSFYPKGLRQRDELGYAAAMSFLLLAVVMLLMWLQFRALRTDVEY